MSSIPPSTAIGEEDDRVNPPGTIASVGVREVNRASMMKRHRTAWDVNVLRRNTTSFVTVIEVEAPPREDIGNGGDIEFMRAGHVTHGAFVL